MVKFDCGKDNFFFRMDDEHGMKDENEEEKTIILEKRCDSRLFILLVNSYFFIQTTPVLNKLCGLTVLTIVKK